MVEQISKYQMQVAFVVEVVPDLKSIVSSNNVHIDEKKYLNYQKIDEIKKEAAIRIKNLIYDAIYKTEIEIKLRDTFNDDKKTMPISNELVEWFMSNSDELLTKLEVA